VLRWSICAGVLALGQASAEVATAEQSPGWSTMLDRVATGIVSIRIDLARSFDTERNVSTQATGFVVDAEKGLILTNRHVVTPGPVRAEALFLNQEEISLTPVYRDPVHDFGLFRYDPDSLRYIQPVELELRPDRATVGREVRIVGNDAGEQLSILSATIARLDRRAPGYGYGKYNDFNTYYIQAASGSSGGSSGSPVLDRSGRVVALNAGASNSAASSFFLPLDRVKRAVELLGAGEPVTRGTLQTKFRKKTFDELRRLGLDAATESRYRSAFPDNTGMLVVREVMTGGPADSSLQVGDILLEVDGQPIVDFVSLERLLDAKVGDSVLVSVERSGQPSGFELTVADLHLITPSEYIEFGGGIFHDLSYQQAWHVNRATKGVYVASPGYMLQRAGVPRKSTILEVEGAPISDLDDFQSVLARLADGQDVAIRFFTMEDPNADVVDIIRIDRRWFSPQRCVRDDSSGDWPCRLLEPGPAAEPIEPASVNFAKQDDRRLRNIANSLVLVRFDMPFTISGVGDRNYYGTGLVVDAENGYVVVDRNTIPEAMGDVGLTFAGSVEVPARVEFVHPLHNLTLLSYDPDLLGETPVRSAQLANELPKPAGELLAAGLNRESRVVSQDVRVAAIEPLLYPLSRTMRYRETNLEAIALTNPPLTFDGVLLDRRGKVAALWSSFAYENGKDVYQENMGMPANIVEEMLELVRNEKPLYSLEAELRPMPLSEARNYGLPDAWVSKLADSDPTRRQLLVVLRTVAGTRAAELLKPGDLLLSVDGLTVTRFRDVEKAVQKPEVSLAVWRNKSEQVFSLETTALDGAGVRRAVLWSGALLQEPYRQLAAQRGIAPVGVYVAYFAYGSPASRAGLGAGSRVVEVDGQKIAGLSDFIAATSGRSDREYVRLTTVAWNGTVRVISVRMDSQYWPASEVFYEDDWQRRPLTGTSSRSNSALAD